MSATDETLALLRSIDASLKALVQHTKQTAPKEIASDRDLDGSYGDPEVKFNPRDWTGPSMKGRKFSECPAEFLGLLAETFDYFAAQAEMNDDKTDTGKPVAPYKRRDAARARGWMARIRAGTHVPAAVAVSDDWV